MNAYKSMNSFCTAKLRGESPRAAVSASGPAVVAYILKGFPRLSETFISNEILLLERMGLNMRLYAIKQGDGPMVSDVLSRLRSPLRYLPATSSLSSVSLLAWLLRNLPRYLVANLQLCWWCPHHYGQTLRQAVNMCVDYRSQADGGIKKVFIKEFLQAAYIANDLRRSRQPIAHMHGHFCHGATTVTWFVSRLLGIGYSFTAHAKDIYQPQLNPGDLLQRKLHAARFVTTCTGSNKDYLDSEYLHQTPVHKIYHGLNTALFKPAPRALKDGAEEAAVPLVLAVGRIVRKKGFLTLVDACAALRERGFELKCLIIGEKGDAYYQLLERIQQLNVRDMVEIRPATAQTELKALYEQATVFALPCQIMADGDRDGIPNVIVEAMAMGLPVVSTRISGIPEIIDHETNGLLVPQRDPAALAAAVGRVLQDAGLRKKLSRNARTCVCRNFDSTQTTVQLKALFDQELARAVTG